MINVSGVSGGVSIQILYVLRSIIASDLGDMGHSFYSLWTASEFLLQSTNMDLFRWKLTLG